MNMLVTINFGQAYREFSCSEDISWELLSEKIAGLFGKETRELSFVYLDDENDPVCISSDIELDEAKLVAEGLLKFQLSSKTIEDGLLPKKPTRIQTIQSPLKKETSNAISEPILEKETPKVKEAFEEKKIDVETQTSGSTTTIWNEVGCDGCSAFPIKGIRFQCMYCPNYDLCEACEAKLGDTIRHPEDHHFIKMRKSINFSTPFEENPFHFEFTTGDDLPEQIKRANQLVSEFTLKMKSQAQSFLSQAHTLKEESQQFIKSYNQKVDEQSKYFKVLASKSLKQTKSVKSQLKEEAQRVIAKQKEEKEIEIAKQREKELEKRRLEQERQEKERQERQKKEQERLEKEKKEQELIEQERIEMEAEREEQERIEKERQERQKKEQERLEKERIEMEAALKRRIQLDQAKREEELKKEEEIKKKAELDSSNAKLMEMGFTDLEKNMSLLVKYNHNLVEVIRELLE